MEPLLGHELPPGELPAGEIDSPPGGVDLPPGAFELPPGAIKLEGHDHRFTIVIVLPDGDRLVTSFDKNVRVHCARTGECLRLLSGHGAAVKRLAALGGDIVASCDWGSGLCLWDISSAGAPLCSEEIDGRVSAFAALGDDEFVVCAYRDLIFYSHCDGRDVARLHEIKNAHDEMIHCVAACSDRFVTGSSDGTVAVWSTDSQQKLAVISGHTIVDFVRIDELHIVNTMTNRAVYVHDAKTLKFFHDVLDNSTEVQSFALVGEGHILTAEEDYHGKLGAFIRLAALPSGEEIARINFPARVYSVDVSPGGWIVAASHLGVFLFPPPPVVARIGIFRERTAAARRASCARIVGLALAVADRMR